MKALLVMNPGSRAGRGQRLWAMWERGLQEASVPFDRVTTSRPGDGREAARTATEYDTVVAVGGDGTINEVLDGVVKSGRGDLRVGVLYSGTSPDFCRFHGVPVAPAAAVRALVSDRARRVDVGRIVYRTEAGGERTAHFGCGCNTGLGASVARLANRWRPFVGDRLGTGAAAVASLLASSPADLSIEIDGERHDLRHANNVSVLKSPYMASGLKIDVDLKASDGRLVVVGLSGKGRLGLLGVLPRFYTGSISADPNVLVRPCRSVEIGADVPQEVEFDGDAHGWLPVRVDVVPQALDLIGGRDE